MASETETVGVMRPEKEPLFVLEVEMCTKVPFFVCCSVSIFLPEMMRAAAAVVDECVCLR